VFVTPCLLVKFLAKLNGFNYRVEFIASQQPCESTYWMFYNRSLGGDSAQNLSNDLLNHLLSARNNKSDTAGFEPGTWVFIAQRGSNLLAGVCSIMLSRLSFLLSLMISTLILWKLWLVAEARLVLTPENEGSLQTSGRELNCIREWNRFYS